MKSAILIAVMALVTVFTRALPFIFFRERTPEYVSYLGKVLPSAIIGMLVVYCLRDTDLTNGYFGAAEIIACACVILMQRWKRNTLLSILSGTAVYMILIHTLFTS